MAIRNFYFFRHGLTDWNKQRRMQGHINIPLNQEGREQALSLRPFFAQNKVELVFSSDLDRAIETAALATGIEQHQVIRHSSLREVNLGESEGLSEEQILRQYGEDSLQRWRSFAPEHRHYALPGGESREECNQRIHQTLLQICRENSFENAALCSHGFVLSRIFHFLSDEKWVPPLIANCVIYKAVYDEKTEKFLVQPSAL